MANKNNQMISQTKKNKQIKILNS